jgi:hypothetical protein
MFCPDRDQLQAYLRGAVSAEVAAHIDGCPACQAALANLPSQEDPFQEQLRRAAREEPFPAEEIRRSVEWVEAVGPIPEERPQSQSPAQQAAAARASTPPPRPLRLGDYELLEPLGEPSGMGVVYRARQVPLDREVALKVVRPDRTNSETSARFFVEMQAVARLAHPNIVRAYDAGEVDGQWFLVMELLTGTSLAQLLERHGAVPIAAACELVRQAAVGLHDAHRQGMVHRDVKPGNLFLTFLGEVKVLDFGLARLQPEGPGDERWTTAHHVMGSVNYMAPEQVVTPLDVDPRADLYALGATLYHLLTGRPPFSAPRYNTRAEKQRGHVYDPVPPVRDFRPEVPPELAALVERLLAKDPAARCSTAAEVAGALWKFTRGANLPALLGIEIPAGAEALPPAALPPVAGVGLDAAQPLHAALDVRLWDEQQRRLVSITEPGALPVRTGTRLQIEARLNRAAYLYLVWITSEGQAVPVYPWERGQWDNRPTVASITRLLLPTLTGTWSIDTPAGVETLVLMARETPLPERVSNEFPQMMTGFPRQATGPFPDRDHWFECRDVECLPGGGTKLNIDVEPIQDPIFQIQTLLREKLGSRFSLIRAVSFANVGKEGVNP